MLTFRVANVAAILRADYWLDSCMGTYTQKSNNESHENIIKDNSFLSVYEFHEERPLTTWPPEFAIH